MKNRKEKSLKKQKATAFKSLKTSELKQIKGGESDYFYNGSKLVATFDRDAK
jgi:hypothetical protein